MEAMTTEVEAALKSPDPDEAAIRSAGHRDGLEAATVHRIEQC